MSRRGRWFDPSRPGRLGAILFFIILAAHLPALLNGFVWDDINDIVLSDRLRDWSALLAVFRNPAMWAADLPVGAVATYRPLSLASFVIDYQIYGLNAWGYHLTSVLLHAVTQLMVFGLLRRWIRPGAAFALTLMTGLHPTCIEAVTWINGRSELFTLLFAVLALRVASSDARSWVKGLSVGVLLLLSMLGKETGLFFVPLAIATPWIPREGMATTSRTSRLSVLLGSGASVAIYFVIRAQALGSGSSIPEVQVLKALAALPAVWFRTLESVLLPFDRSIVPVSIWLKSLTDAAQIGYLVGAVLIVALWVALLVNRRWLAVFGLSWWLLIQVPLPMIVITEWPGLHRWLYAGLPGLGLAVYALGHGLLKPRWERALGVALVVALCVLTQRAIPVWRNQTTLFITMTEEWPDAAYGYQSLGVAFLHLNQNEAAEAALRGAIDHGTWSSRAYWLWAAAVSRQDRCDEGVTEVYNHPQAVRDPELTSVLDIAECYNRQQRLEAARQFYILCADRFSQCRDGLAEVEARLLPPEGSVTPETDR